MSPLVVRRLSALLVAAGLVLMGWPVATWAYGVYWQAQLARELALPPAVATTAAAETAPSASPPRAAAAAAKKPLKKAPKPVKKPPAPRSVPGGAFARLRIERIDLDAVVVEGDDARSLRRGPGHLPETGRPGEPRNCAIAAHRDGWFSRLHEVRVGDPVLVRTRGGGVFEYEVSERRVVTPDRGDLLDRGPFPDLTLITCTGPGYPRSKYRLLVFCRLREEL